MSIFVILNVAQRSEESLLKCKTNLTKKAYYYAFCQKLANLLRNNTTSKTLTTNTNFFNIALYVFQMQGKF